MRNVIFGLIGTRFKQLLLSGVGILRPNATVFACIFMCGIAMAQSPTVPAGTVVFAPMDGSPANLVTRTQGALLGGEYTTGRISEALSTADSTTTSLPQGVRLTVPVTSDWSASLLVLNSGAITGQSSTTAHLFSRGSTGLAFVPGGGISPVGIGFQTVIAAPIDWPSGRWRHFMVVKAGTDLRLSRDGTAIARWTVPASFAASGDLVIAANSSGGQGLGGLVDEMIWFDRALLDAEAASVMSAFAVANDQSGPRWSMALADGSGSVLLGDDFGRADSYGWGQATAGTQFYTRLGIDGSPECNGLICDGSTLLGIENGVGVFRYVRPTNIPSGASMRFSKRLTYINFGAYKRSVRLFTRLRIGQSGRVGHRIGFNATSEWAALGSGILAERYPMDGLGVNLTQASAGPSQAMISMVVERYVNGAVEVAATTNCPKLPAGSGPNFTLSVSEQGQVEAKLGNCSVNGNVPSSTYGSWFAADRNSGLPDEFLPSEDTFAFSQLWARTGNPSATTSTTMIESLPNAAVVGASFTANVRVTPAPSGIAASVRLTTSQSTLCTVFSFDANGRGSCSGNIGVPGTYLVKAEFSGTPSLAASNSPPTQMIVAPASVNPTFTPAPNSQINVSALIGGVAGEAVISVANGSAANSQLTLACTPADSRFQAIVPGPIEPGGSGSLRVRFSPSGSGPAVIADMPCVYTGGSAVFSLRGLAVLSSSHVGFTPLSGGVIEFNAYLPQPPATLRAFASVASTSPAELLVTDCVVAGGGYVLSGPTNVTYAPGQSGPVASVIFTPTVAGTFDGLITCQSNVGSLSWVARAVMGAAPVNTPPTVHFSPTTGSAVALANSSVSSASATISASPSGGQGTGAAATTAVGSCQFTGTGALAFNTPNNTPTSLTFTGIGTQASTLALSCNRGTTNLVATMSCTVNRAGTQSIVSWPTICPARDPLPTLPIDITLIFNRQNMVTNTWTFPANNSPLREGDVARLAVGFGSNASQMINGTLRVTSRLVAGGTVSLPVTIPALSSSSITVPLDLDQIAFTGAVANTDPWPIDVRLEVDGYDPKTATTTKTVVPPFVIIMRTAVEIGNPIPLRDALQATFPGWETATVNAEGSCLYLPCTSAAEINQLATSLQNKTDAILNTTSAGRFHIVAEAFTGQIVNAYLATRARLTPTDKPIVGRFVALNVPYGGTRCTELLSTLVPELAALIGLPTVVSQRFTDWMLESGSRARATREGAAAFLQQYPFSSMRADRVITFGSTRFTNGGCQANSPGDGIITRASAVRYAPPKVRIAPVDLTSMHGNHLPDGAAATLRALRGDFDASVATATSEPPNDQRDNDDGSTALVRVVYGAEGNNTFPFVSGSSGSIFINLFGEIDAWQGARLIRVSSGEVIIPDVRTNNLIWETQSAPNEAFEIRINLPRAIASGLTVSGATLFNAPQLEFDPKISAATIRVITSEVSLSLPSTLAVQLLTDANVVRAITLTRSAPDMFTGVIGYQGVPLGELWRLSSTLTLTNGLSQSVSKTVSDPRTPVFGSGFED